MQKPHATVVLSSDDRMKAFYRHTEFQRYCTLWREVFRKLVSGVPFTEEEDALFCHRAEYGLNRNEFNLEAERQAAGFNNREFPWEKRERCATSEAWSRSGMRAPILDRKSGTLTLDLPLEWATKTIVGMAVLATRAAKSGRPRGRRPLRSLERDALSPQINAEAQVLTVCIPLDYSIETIEETLQGAVRYYKDLLGIVADQPKRRPKLDPWLVYDLHHDHGLSFAKVTKQFFYIPDEEDVNAWRNSYDRVINAYQFAERAIAHVGLKNA